MIDFKFPGPYDTRLMHLLFFLLFIFAGCNTSPKENIALQPICGRDAEHRFIYRVQVPVEWGHHAPSLEESLIDTTKPLCEFVIDEQIKITIHNFPSESLENRIPPEAQIGRWKRQFSFLDLSSVSIISQAYSGFKGLLFEGNGTLNGSKESMMGWSMQLAPLHYRTLTHLNPPNLQQIRSDVTIKAVGPTNLMEQHREQIIRFARSFELIEAIPSKT